MRPELDTAYRPLMESGYKTKINTPLKETIPEDKPKEPAAEAIKHRDGKGLFVDTTL